MDTIREVLIKRSKVCIESQQKKNLKSLESSLRKTQSYRCDRCRDMTFVVVGDEAIGSRLIEMSKDYLVKMKGRKMNYRIYG
ncbi:hypothetical protein H8891_02490 [Paeniclostridium sp. NSJ-45]|uniref:Uncharacterized protein n=1 Tax=Paeniclostridium hominis TaxID=2764329 RepID=A0ABR7K0L4_9FIRM|nr:MULTISPECIES: hypothetical protein [Paeniclostridium]MBC6002656.1 hypothetical protein [Paeniclostridium hominis]